jgi:hypothetical protein
VDELIKLVAEKTGLSREHAKLAVDTVLAFVKTRLPAPLAAQIDAVVGGGGVSGGLGQAGDIAKSLGGFFNKGS